MMFNVPGLLTIPRVLVQVDVEPPLTSLIKSNRNDNTDTDFVKLKLFRDPTSYKSDLYELKMALFNNGYPEQFCCFARNFNMTLAASGTLGMDAKVQYIFMLVYV